MHAYSTESLIILLVTFLNLVPETPRHVSQRSDHACVNLMGSLKNKVRCVRLVVRVGAAGLLMSPQMALVAFVVLPFGVDGGCRTV